MSRLVWTAAVIAVLLSGCGGSPSVDDQPSLTEQMVEIMKTIKDADSAKSAAPKLEALAEKIHTLQKESLKGTAPSDPESFMQRQVAALDAYGAEMTRISNIPGAPQHLQGMIKKLTPDSETTAAFNSRVEQALDGARPNVPMPGDSKPGDVQSASPIDGAAANIASGARPAASPNSVAPGPQTPPAANPAPVATPAAVAAAQPAAVPAPAKFDLRPDPNFKGPIPERSVTWELSQWFPTARKGDFVEFEAVLGRGPQGDVVRRERHEVLDVVGEYAIIASVDQLDTHKNENRVKMKVAANEPWPPRPSWPPKALGAQTIMAAGRQFPCEGVKYGGVTAWYCDEVPYNRTVKHEQHGVNKMLIAYGRGSGPSPVVPAIVTASPMARPISAPQAQAVRPAAPPPATPPAPQGASSAEKIESLQASIDEYQREIDRSTKELKAAEANVEGLEKKLKRLAIASSKSKRGKNAKSEFDRELKQARSEISKLKREIQKNEERLGKAEKDLKFYQDQAAGAG
ncbi:MAG TPA: hypothetical protein VHC19_19455 [Pirellulales bacterium]|nr:hypothetical protein [Pirellulales bacterium]